MTWMGNDKSIPHYVQQNHSSSCPWKGCPSDKLPARPNPEPDHRTTSLFQQPSLIPPLDPREDDLHSMCHPERVALCTLLAQYERHFWC
ncbi:hypothetical protein B0F90DRAFT_624649 [Multifurca ochricompacta]|uniref:Uncharacterized protein n=1 Tax=Multifurca ochricompacta TaxID=376703 RepID=A0AAD4LTU9_9AGAM|nr:hypothetical protein B0F90DRAFT_624649 [Multifurca ochricompacta]